ncbi:MAG TPA: peptidylprolyl isomerase [Longimicrobiales bacterium]|nr:peptidylprolyl isomerase [Longimicrobiales bacterium]
MRILVPALCLWTLSCGLDTPAALVVGPLGFTESQLLGLGQARRQSLANLAAFGLAVADSSTAELGAPLVERWRDDRLLDILAAELALEAHDVDEAVLEARYLTDPEHELTVRHILFFSERWRTDAERAEARAKAERALEAIRGGADFAETAARLSEEPGAEGRQGLLTPGRRGAWVDEFWRAASALQPGEISPVTETRYGFHILRLEDRQVVPFVEARSRVAREVARSIEDPRAALDAWMAERAAGLSVSERAVDWLAGGGTGPVGDVATWPGGGRLTAEDYRRWAATQPASWAGAPSGGDVPAVRDAVGDLALRRMALAEAERRALSVPEAERSEIARRWDDLAYRWSASLGFAAGMSPASVGEAALQALGSTAQGVTIVREELDARSPLLRARYPVSIADPGA